jgi:hypothetical protein
MSTDDEVRPWDYPPIVLEPVKFEEVLEMFEKCRADTITTVLNLTPRESSEADILSFSYGSGYYRRDVTPRGDREFLWPGLTYFAVEVGNVRLLILLDPRGHAIYVQARPDAKATWGGWYTYHNRPIPIDRFLLMTEIAKYA